MQANMMRFGFFHKQQLVDFFQMNDHMGDTRLSSRKVESNAEEWFKMFVWASQISLSSSRVVAPEPTL